MRSTSRLERQSLGCGYEPPAPKGIPVATWDHEGRKHRPGEYDGNKPRLPICPGYVCQLPEVIEVARARMHWERGELGPTFCHGEAPSDRLIEGLEILEGSVNEFQHWDLTKDRKK